MFLQQRTLSSLVRALLLILFFCLISSRASLPDVCVRTFTKLRDSSGAVDWPPPCPAPAHLVAGYERNSMPITRDFCLAQRHEGRDVVRWSEEYLEGYRADIAAGRDGGSYTTAHIAQLRGALRAHADVLNGDARVVVVGTDRPWIEVMLLDEGAARVLTFEYGAIESAHPRISARACRDVAGDFLRGEFEPADAVVSFSSIEHSGLGRYGDALDPEGDVDAMAQVWCMLRPGGLAFIGLPMTCQDVGATEFNAHRIYGVRRLARIFRGFEFVAFDEQGCQPYLPSREPQPVIILRKPAGGEWNKKSIRKDILRAIDEGTHDAKEL
jgi:hypothetical protein